MSLSSSQYSFLASYFYCSTLFILSTLPAHARH